MALQTKVNPSSPRMGTDFPCEQYLGSAAFYGEGDLPLKVEGFGPESGG